MYLSKRAVTCAIICYLASISAVRAETIVSRPPAFQSPQVAADGAITFSLHAPKAEIVVLAAGDLPGIRGGAPMAKGDDGIWSYIAKGVPAGAYRYHFDVDGVRVLDPRNTATSESNENAWSLVTVPGPNADRNKQIPHGAVAEVRYYAESLKQMRRMHVYTPPGYEKSTDSYPVFYLLHGAFDCDDSWSTVGQAGLILDELIAGKEAKPMIVVMPDGHTGPFRFGPGGDANFVKQMAAFQVDFTTNIRPLIESRYRTKNDRNNRAIAGLSMGGAQTLNIAFDALEDFAYIGVFSSGVFGIAGRLGGGPPSTEWEDNHKPVLENKKAKAGLRLIWFGMGREDFLRETGEATVAMLRKHEFEVTYKETAGGHTWANWRAYLREFAPRLFR